MQYLLFFIPANASSTTLSAVLLSYWHSNTEERSKNSREWGSLLCAIQSPLNVTHAGTKRQRMDSSPDRWIKRTSWKHKSKPPPSVLSVNPELLIITRRDTPTKADLLTFHYKAAEYHHLLEVKLHMYVSPHFQRSASVTGVQILTHYPLTEMASCLHLFESFILTWQAKTQSSQWCVYRHGSGWYKRFNRA